MIDAKYIAYWMNGKPMVTLISALKHLVDIQLMLRIESAKKDEFGYWEKKDSNARRTKFYSRKARLVRDVKHEFPQEIFEMQIVDNQVILFSTKWRGECPLSHPIFVDGKRVNYGAKLSLEGASECCCMVNGKTLKLKDDYTPKVEESIKRIIRKYALRAEIFECGICQ